MNHLKGISNCGDFSIELVSELFAEVFSCLTLRKEAHFSPHIPNRRKGILLHMEYNLNTLQKNYDSVDLFCFELFTSFLPLWRSEYFSRFGISIYFFS
jgi:hypothetical protein